MADGWKEFKNIVGFDPTSLDRVSVPATLAGKAYNLSGQQVGDGAKGIVVKDGKKVVRK